MKPKVHEGKNSYMSVGLLGFVIASIFAADALAMYNPGLGRFMQRDPGAGAAKRVGAGGPSTGGSFIPRDQYADGMNLYQYVRSNPINGLDPTGLWKSERKTTEARAIATAEEGDTLTSLGYAIDLNPEEFPLWGRGEIRIQPNGTTWYIHNWNTKMATDEVLNTTICPGEKVSIPNTAYIDVSSYAWGPLELYLRGFKSGLDKSWSRQGLHVVYTDRWTTTKNTILSHLASKDIYMYAYIGHGASGCMTGVTGADNSVTPGDKYTPYGIAGMFIIACESHDMSWWWKKNLSAFGVLTTVKGSLNYFNRVFVNEVNEVGE